MRRYSIIAVTALIALWLIATTVRDFIDAVRHFSAQPRDLLYVAGIAMLGGLATLSLTRLSARTQKHLRVSAWGAAASSLTLFVCYFVFRLASLSSLAIESGATAWVVLALFLFSAIAAFLWFEFHRAWKAGVSR